MRLFSYEVIMRHYSPRPSPLPIPETSWNDDPLYCLRLNGDWVSHVVGVLGALDQPDAWVGSEEEQWEARQQVNQIIKALMEACQDMPIEYPQSQTLWHDQAIVTSGAALETISLSQSPYNTTEGWYNTISYQNTAVNGDSFYQSCLLDAGDYTMHFLGGENLVHGMVDWYLDDELTPFEAGQDWYAASFAPNILKTANLTVPVAGRHTITAIVNGKNGSSFGYYLPLVKYWFEFVP